MTEVKGTIRNGVAIPLEPVRDTDEGRSVIITFVDDVSGDESTKGNGGVSLDQLIKACQVDTGIEDLAAQHDHYLYGTPKR